MGQDDVRSREWPWLRVGRLWLAMVVASQVCLCVWIAISSGARRRNNTLVGPDRRARRRPALFLATGGHFSESVAGAWNGARWPTGDGRDDHDHDEGIIQKFQPVVHGTVRLTAIVCAQH
jgi:4-amino-4-deoxy-L-arabinose transferase-like glycosyltransferase